MQRQVSQVLDSSHSQTKSCVTFSATKDSQLILSRIANFWLTVLKKTKIASIQPWGHTQPGNPHCRGCLWDWGQWKGLELRPDESALASFCLSQLVSGEWKAAELLSAERDTKGNCLKSGFTKNVGKSIFRNKKTYFSLFMTDCKVLSATMGWGQDTHGHTAKNVCTDKLAYSLPLVTTVIHPHILKSSLLRAKRGHLGVWTRVTNADNDRI